MLSQFPWPSEVLWSQATASLDHYKLHAACINYPQGCFRGQARGQSQIKASSSTGCPRSQCRYLTLSTVGTASPGEWSLLSPSCPLLGWSSSHASSLHPEHSPRTPHINLLALPDPHVNGLKVTQDCASTLHLSPLHSGPWPSCLSKGPSSCSYMLSRHVLGP